MIRFDFTVSDEEAQTVFDCFETCIDRADNEALNSTGEMHNWWSAHAKYLRRLREKLTNTGVE
jgi:L-rhamnose mutarotase